MQPANKILIAHYDNEKTAEWALVLRAVGYEVKYTPRPEEAMRELSPNVYGAVILGLAMPITTIIPARDWFESEQYTGFAMAKFIRDMYPKMPILIVSRASSHSVIDWCEENPPALFYSWYRTPAHKIVQLLQEVLAQKRECI